MVLPRLPVRPCAASWFADMPAGIAIMMDMEMLRTTITSSALILRRDMFLNALDAMPVFVTVLFVLFVCLGVGCLVVFLSSWCLVFSFTLAFYCL